MVANLTLDMMASPLPLRQVGDLARRAESAGFGTMWFTEGARTASLSCAASALATERLGLGTAIAVAFPRSPMVTAQMAWELAEATGGGYVVGLGTQVKAHVERRYSSTYAPPGPRLREYVRAVKTIFRAFRGEEKLAFEGDYYSFNLLPRMWSPGPIDVADPPVYISAVLPWMSRMAGAECDGIHIHPMHSPGWLTDVQLPEVAAGAASTGRSMDDVTVVCPVIIAVGDTDEEIAVARDANRATIAFYGSTPNYAPVLEHHGFDGLQGELNACQRSGDMATMVDLVADDVLDHYTVSATWSDLGGVLADRYRGMAPHTRVMTYTALDHWRRDPDLLDRWSDVARHLADAD